MNMDAIGIMNDAVGGVKVNVTADFSRVDPSIQMGEMVLDGNQARTYIQTRRDVGNQLNLSRMERHGDCMKGFVEALRVRMDSNDTFILDAYEKVSPYLVTDCSANTLSGMVKRYTNYTMGEIVSPVGRNVLTEEYYEFHVDEEQLQDLVLRLFYREK